MGHGSATLGVYQAFPLAQCTKLIELFNQEPLNETFVLDTENDGKWGSQPGGDVWNFWDTSKLPNGGVDTSDCIKNLVGNSECKSTPDTWEQEQPEFPRAMYIQALLV